MMIIHIRNLDEEDSPRKVYEEQRKNIWPGLAQETAIICDQEDCNETRLSKSEYRKLVTAACHIQIYASIREEASEKKC